MKVAVGQKPPAVFRFASVTIDGNKVTLGNHDADSGLLIQKKVTDTLEIIPSYEWVGASKTATISIKAGYKDWAGNFTPKTGAYTRNIELPESPDTPYSGVLEEPIVIPLTACGDISDGAIEIVAKLPDMSDYITQVWNVYATKAPVVNFRFSAVDIDGNTVQLTDHDADSDLLLPKTTADRLEIVPAFEWQGPRKAATINVKAGYKDWAGGFTPKTDAYTRNIELPESIETVYQGQLTSPISIPLTACGGLTDGALEVVLKISGVSDYISHIWNVYTTKAPEEVIDFSLTRPTASPSEVSPGATVTITCPVTSKCTKSQTVTAKVYIYEGSIYAGHGTLITTKTSPAFSIAPGKSYDVIVNHTAIAGSIDRRDVEVEIYVGGKLVKESEWDDVYYVIPEVELELLEVKIDPSGAGYVTVSPAPESGTQHNWYFPHGTTVYVTAHPNSGYKFKSWSGEMTDTTDITAPVYPMTEKRTITAHFEKEVEYKGSIISKILKYDSAQTTIPAGGVPLNSSAQINIWGRNDSSVEQDLCISYIVTAPNGQEFKYSDWSFGHGPGNDHHFIGDRFTLAQKGEYTIKIGLFMNRYDPIQVAYYGGRLCIVESEAPVGISFKVSIWGIPSDFGSYEKWFAHYFDPGIDDFVSCGKWYSSSEKIPFNNVQSGGYLAVFLKKNSTVSSQYTSPIFQAADGGSYTYDVQYGRIYG